MADSRYTLPNPLDMDEEALIAEEYELKEAISQINAQLDDGPHDPVWYHKAKDSKKYKVARLELLYDEMRSRGYEDVPESKAQLHERKMREQAEAAAAKSALAHQRQLELIEAQHKATFYRGFYEFVKTHFRSVHDEVMAAGYPVP